MLPITNNDILIDVINLNGNKKTIASIKQVVVKILLELGMTHSVVDDYVLEDSLRGVKEFNQWLDLYNSIPKDVLVKDYIELNKTKNEICKKYGITLFELNKYIVRYNLYKGLGNKGRTPPNRRDPNQEEATEIVNLYKKGLSLKAISKTTKYSKDALVRTLEISSVPLRLNIHNEKNINQFDVDGKYSIDGTEIKNHNYKSHGLLYCSKRTRLLIHCIGSK